MNAEAAQLASLHAAAFAGRARGWSPDEIAALAAAPGVALVVEGTPPLGFALARVAADEAEVLTIAVDPAHRGRGIGARLLAQAETCVRTAGAVSMVLEVDADNPAALALYLRAGFAAEGVRRDYTQAGVDAMILRKRLDAD